MNVYDINEVVNSKTIFVFEFKYFQNTSFLFLKISENVNFLERSFRRQREKERGEISKFTWSLLRANFRGRKYNVKETEKKRELPPLVTVIAKFSLT